MGLHASAYLATVNSEDEDNTITAMMSADTWIGLNDKVLEETFTWLQDSSASVSFTNWFGTSPNIGTNSTNQDCVVKKNLGNTNHGKWRDVTCGKTLPYACRMPAISC